MANLKCPKFRFALALVITLGFAVCIVPPDAWGGGVHFGFGVEVPGPPVVAPAPVYAPPVVVERTPPPPVVYERAAPPPPPVVVRRTPPTVVYEGPVIVEYSSTVYYYPPTPNHRTYREERESTYQRRTRTWTDRDIY